MAAKTADITILPVQASEVAELADLASRVYADTYGAYMSAADLQATLKQSRSESYFRRALTESKILVAKQSRRIVGYVQYGKVKIPEAPASPQDRALERLYVETPLQGQGIGRALAEAALKTPEMLSATRIFLQVWERNPRAIKLYQSLGFTTVGVTRFIIGNGLPAEDLIMVRPKVTEPSTRRRPKTH